MNNRIRLPTPSSTLCTEAEVEALVRSFYARVQRDELLGPIFAAHVHDWEQHLGHLIDFWSALLRGTRRFAGSPMQKHMAIDGLSAELFERWLGLFAETTASLGNTPMQRLADDAAARIGDNFWRRYQMTRWPALPPVLR